jgi:Fic family protein
MAFNRLRPYNELPPLPPPIDLESKAILKKCISAHRALATLKGAGDLIPNQAILINAIPLQEAKASSEIENIVTTGDDLYQADVVPGITTDPHTREVLRYRTALRRGYDLLDKHSISVVVLKEICEVLLNHEVQIRWFGDARIINRATNEVVFTAPEGGELLHEKMGQLERFIHEDGPLDPLIRLALIHYQFEAIHPFEDGNGRTGRILNILYLIEQGLLAIPVLYLSRAIIARKNDYYRLLREVTEEQAWEQWVLFMLSAIEETSLWTYSRILAIRSLLEKTAETYRDKLPSAVYSKDLIELIFVQPYCKIQFVVDAGIAQRQTAAGYLQQLEDIGVLESKKIGRERVFINPPLLKLLMEP